MTDIYFITNGKNIKIGRSKNIEERIVSLQTGNDVELKLLYTIPNMPEYFEKHIHIICDRYNIKGEWFSLDALNHLLNHPWFKDNMKKIDKKILI